MNIRIEGRAAADGRLTAASGSPVFQPGEVVRAAVESVQGSGALLRIRGMLLRAQTDLPLLAGETLDLMVAAAGADQIHLRRMAPAAAETKPMANPDLARTPDGGAGHTEALAARALAAYQLPLEPGAVTRLARLLAALPAAEQELAASAAAWLAAGGQPVHAGAVRNLLAAAGGPRPWSLQPRLERLARALESAAAALSEAGQPDRAADLQGLARELRQWGWRPGSGETGTARRPAAAPAEMTARPDTAHQSDPAHHPDTPSLPDRPAAPRTSGAATRAATADRVPPGRSAVPGDPAGQADGPDQPPAALLPRLLARAGEVAGTLPGSLRSEVRSAAREAQTLLQTLSRLSDGPPEAMAQWQVWPLPMSRPPLEGELLIMRRQPRRGGGEGRDEGEEVRLFFHSPHLGPLAIHLTWRAGAVAVACVAGAEAAAALHQALPGLRAALQRRGLPVAGLAAVAGEPRLPEVFRPPAARPPQGLNLKL